MHIGSLDLTDIDGIGEARRRRIRDVLFSLSRKREREKFIQVRRRACINNALSA